MTPEPVENINFRLVNTYILVTPPIGAVIHAIERTPKIILRSMNSTRIRILNYYTH